MRISKFSQSSSSAINNHSGVKTCRVAEHRARQLSHNLHRNFQPVVFSILIAAILIGSPDLFLLRKSRLCLTESWHPRARSLDSAQDRWLIHTSTSGAAESQNLEGAPRARRRELELGSCRTSNWTKILLLWTTRFVNRTLCYTACTHVNTVHTAHCTDWLHAHAWLKVELCALKTFLSFHLLFRAMGHDLDSTPSTLTFFCCSYFSFTHLLRLKVDHVWSILRQFTRPGGEGFMDPQPRTGYEPNRTVGNPIVTEQEIEHSTEESQIQEIEDKFSFPYNQSLLSSTQDSIERSAMPQEADLDDEQIRALLASPRCLPEREASAERSQIYHSETEGCCQVHLKVWTSKAQGDLLYCVYIRKDLSQDAFSEREQPVDVSVSDESIFRNSHPANVAKSPLEVICLLKRELKWWRRNTKVESLNICND